MFETTRERYGLLIAESSLGTQEKYNSGAAVIFLTSLCFMYSHTLLIYLDIRLK